MSRVRPLPPQSGLVNYAWQLEDVGRVRVAVPTLGDMDALDESWSGLRPREHHNVDWRWKKILRPRPERHALRNDTEILALWTSRRHRLLRLPEGPCFRLDYFEIHPSYRGGFLGVFAFSIIAARALEQNAWGLVLASLPGSENFYRELGGERRRARGWEHERNLIPFVFQQAKLEELRDAIDELRED